MVDRHHPGKAPTALLQALGDGSCRTIGQLEADLDLTRRQVSDAAASLLRRGYLMRMAIGCYQLTDVGLTAASSGEVITSGPRGPHFGIHIVRNTIRSRAWSAMRMRRQFTLPDIIMDAATAEDRAPEDNLGRYLRALHSAGIVAPLPRRAEGGPLTSNGYKVWVLRRDLGRLAPIVLSKVKAVRDRNSGEDLPCKPRS